MKILTTIRYEVFYRNTDTTHEQDWVAFTAMMHDGTDFVVYESSFYYKKEMPAAEWDKLMERIETAAKSPLCEISSDESLLNRYDCTTYTIDTYRED
jgi:hypothetical protein